MWSSNGVGDGSDCYASTFVNDFTAEPVWYHCCSSARMLSLHASNLTYRSKNDAQRGKRRQKSFHRSWSLGTEDLRQYLPLNFLNSKHFDLVLVCTRFLDEEEIRAHVQQAAAVVPLFETMLDA